MRIFLYKIFFFCLFFSVLVSEAQTLTFGRSVNKDGQIVGAAQMFALPKNGGTVVFHLQYPPSKSLPSVSFDIYKVEGGKETFISTIKQSAEPSKTWLSKGITIYDSGMYRVYIYDEHDHLVVKSNFTVKVAAN